MNERYEYITSCPHCGFPADVDMSIVLTSHPPQYRVWCKQESCGESFTVFANEIMRRINMSREELFELGKSLEQKVRFMNNVVQNEMVIEEDMIDLYKKNYMEMFNSLIEYDEKMTRYLNWKKSEQKREDV